jgi:hypothetical protein
MALTRINAHNESVASCLERARCILLGADPAQWMILALIIEANWQVLVTSDSHPYRVSCVNGLQLLALVWLRCAVCSTLHTECLREPPLCLTVVQNARHQSFTDQSTDQFYWHMPTNLLLGVPSIALRPWCRCYPSSRW